MSAKGTIFIALFSGINVGGNRIVKMAELRTFFEDLGFSRCRHLCAERQCRVPVRARATRPALTSQMEAAFEKKWGFHSRIMVRDVGWFERLVSENPYPEVARRTDQAPCLCAGARAERSRDGPAVGEMHGSRTVRDQG